MAEIGTVLGGRYRLIELLGQGGMATIYRAHDVQLDRDVAVKLLRSEYGRDPDFLARFRQEAQNVAQLNHPNVVGVYDYGQDPSGPFIVMELIDGEDLASILRRTGPLPPRQAGRIAAEVARALAAAHARGIIHRDVKPGNVLVSADGRVKVTDFGIARAMAEAQMTLPGTTLGSVHYFSPEQVRGESADETSDIYALGIVLYEMLTGRRPWEGDNAAAIALARLSGPTPSPSSIRQGIPPVLEAIDRKALASDPDARFPSAAAMANALETYLAGRPVPEVAAAAGMAGADGTAGGTGAAARGSSTAVVPSSAQPPSVQPGARVPYPDDAYARSVEGPVVPARQVRRSTAVDVYRDERQSGTSGWVWVAGLFALLILVAIGFFAFQLLNRGGAPGASAVPQVAVPNFIGLTYDQAKAQADQLGIVLVQSTFASSTQPANTILDQDPKQGARIDKGAQVRLTLAAGAVTVAVPDLRGLTEAQAIQAILNAGLGVGDRSDSFDPVVPIGSVISQDPRAALQVPAQTPVNYVVSKGPQPTPSPLPTATPSPSPSPSVSPTPTPTPSPTPTPTPTPTPSPTPPPTPTPQPTPPPTPAPTPTPQPTPQPTPTPTPPPPTPSPTAAPLTVGEYRCMSLDAATAHMTNDGFTLGTISTDPAGASFDTSWTVHDQVPLPGEQRPPGTAINVTVRDPARPCP